jgi:hypothetical protein
LSLADLRKIFLNGILTPFIDDWTYVNREGLCTSGSILLDERGGS